GAAAPRAPGPGVAQRPGPGGGPRRGGGRLVAGCRPHGRAGGERGGGRDAPGPGARATQAGQGDRAAADRRRAGGDGEHRERRLSGRGRWRDRGRWSCSSSPPWSSADRTIGARGTATPKSENVRSVAATTTIVAPTSCASTASSTG